MMNLRDLLQQMPFEWTLAGGEAFVSGISMDSRQVEAGDIFVAIRGETTDGHQYIPNAVQRGAGAIVGSEPPPAELPVPYVRVHDGRLALAYLAAGLQGFPTRKLVLIGVTGTDGKTTTSNMIYEILKSAELKVGMISTVNAQIGELSLDTGFHVTTPDAPDIQGYLAQMVAAGTTHVILEATSHGLAQGRLLACDFDFALVTNITHEHLDYHGTYEAYREAKGLLFSGLDANDPVSGAVLNRDDESFDYLASITRVPCLSYGLHPEADVRPVDVDWTGGDLRYTAVGADVQGEPFHIEIRCPLTGEYNLSNSMGAVTLTRGLMMIHPEAVQQGLANMTSIPGRMEKIDLGQDFLAIVDFAHTPNALKRALQSGRKLTQGRVIAVFGSAGLRDREKRRLMAEASAELANLTVLTAEDPRTDLLDGILDEMAQGMLSKGAQEGVNFWRVPDRREALRFAIRLAEPGDLVIACGKGHEQSMCFGTTEYPWDDRVALRAALAELVGAEGPDMPFLPEAD